MSDIVYVWITFKSVAWSKLITLQGVIGVIQLGNGFDTSKTGEFCSELIDQYSPRVFQSLSHILSLSLSLLSACFSLALFHILSLITTNNMSTP